MGITVRAEATTFGSIAGEFVRIDVAELAHAWHTCRSRSRVTGDFRAWLAAREVVARRQEEGEGRPGRFDIAELAALLDVSPRSGTGDALGNRGHGDALRRGRSRGHAYD